MTGKRIALIPAYQPSVQMLRLISELCSRDFDVIVVDDGSGSDYEYIFHIASLSARVLRHNSNRGKGEALKTGMTYIKSRFTSPYAVVTADADGQHLIGDIVRVCDEALQYRGSLVLGSRRFDKDVPLKSKLGNSITRVVFKLSSGMSVYDTQTGLRAFSDKLIDRLLKIDGSRFEYEMNVLMELSREKTELREVTIETVYMNKNAASHFNPIKDSYRIYREILKFSASSLLSFLLDYGLFCLLSALTGAVLLPNVIARICSSILNFTLNKKIVFRSKEKLLFEAVKYFSLVIVILIANSLVLRALISFGINTFAAKIITELTMFSLSFAMQHSFVFKKRRLHT